MKSSKVGKPSLATVVGEGTSKQCNLPMAGQVLELGKENMTNSISREPGQDKPHMKVHTDDGTCINSETY